MKRQLLVIAAALAMVAAPFSASARQFAKAPVLHQSVESPLFSPEINIAPAGAGKAATPFMDSRAASTMTYALCGDIYSALRLNGMSAGDTVWQGVEFVESDANQYAGNQITALNIAAGSSASRVNLVTDITVFLTYDLNGEPFYTQDATLSSTAYTYNKVTLDTPYTIEAGKSFYFGFYFKMTAANASAYYIVIDYNQYDDPAGSWIGATDGTTGETQWMSTYDSYGYLCITADITGENMPKDNAQPTWIHSPYTVNPDTSFDIDFEVTNVATNDISEVEVEYTVGSVTKTQTVKLESPIGYKQATDCAITGATCDVTGSNIPVSIKITKVNGVDNNGAEATVNDVINCLPAGTGYDRTMVVEEGTGTWCGYCPLGITLMEWLRTNVTDGSIIPIAVHLNDEMSTSSYNSVINRFFQAVPNYVANRDEYYQMGFYSNLSQNQQILNAIYSDLSQTKAVSDIYVDAAYANESKNSIAINATTQFAVSTDAEYRVAFVLVEDGVGPYEQSNYLSGESAPGYEEFTSGGETVSVTYNDVARNIISADGISGSIPATIEAGEAYTYNRTVLLNTVGNHANARLVAMVINAATGEIDNATAISLADLKVADNAIESITAESAVKVAGANGCITFAGEYESATIYSATGAAVATAAGESSVSVPAGFYIVKADGKATKVIVR